MIIDAANRKVIRDKWGMDLPMINGAVTVAEPLIMDSSRVFAFSQSPSVGGSLRGELSPGIGFTIASSNQGDNGLIYCEVII